MRIKKATLALAEKVSSSVSDGDTIAIFGSSSAVVAGLQRASQAGRKFDVLVIDGRPLSEGRFH